MDTFEVGGKQYQVVIVNDEYGAQVALYNDGERLVGVVVDLDGTVSVEEKALGKGLFQL